MKNMKSVIALASVLLLFACEEKEPAPIELSGIRLDKNELTMKKGESAVLTFKVVPEDALYEQVLWMSSEPSVATVDQSGNVTAVAPGTADITLTVDEVSAICKVTVEITDPEKIMLDITEHRLLIGGSFSINATVLPEDADDKTVTWASSDEAVASVSEEGEVTALAAGNAVITASCGELTADCNVTVYAMPLLGDYYYSDGSWSTELEPDKEVVGMVFYIAPDNASGKIFSLDEFYDPAGGEYAEYTMWCTGEMEEVGCNHEFEGRLNMDIMKEHQGWEENYPPFKWCADKTDGGFDWYLPAKAEWRQLLCGMVGYKWVSEGADSENKERNDWQDNDRVFNGSEWADEKEAFNARVEAAGGTPFNVTGNMYWASTENGVEEAGHMTLSTGRTGAKGKDDPYGRVRAITIFAIE